MRNPDTVVIERAILHLVAPKRRGLVLSEVDLSAPQEGELGAFLAGHVKSGLADSQTRAAKFVAVEPERVSGLCQRMITGRNFVEHSQAVSRRLFEIVERDGRVSDGVLAHMRYRTGTRPGAERHLAILKLDPADAFIPVESHDEQGRLMVTLALQQEVMPSTRQKLQKCAFVRKIDDGDEYHLLVLDRQTAAAATRFFMADFLGAELAFDAREHTDRLYRALVTAGNALSRELEPAVWRRVDRMIQTVMDGDSVDLDTWLPTLPVTEGQRNQVDEAIRAALPDRQFDLDPDLAHRLVRRRTFAGDHNLRLTVDAEAIDDMIEIEDVQDTDPPRKRITIETVKWQEQR